ncbi:Photosystem I reaction center subunit XI [Prochlorococcus marinus str. MIT 1342]|jgi:photosystem I subunit 11|uniref:Photosystem I reaction center subunit XI n=2 Tax=Prochlorococcus marinus TaxID=1219 RepID=Q7V512_PROMM|nr:MULTISPECIES: photosystem I reaction center protein subunit XI [Prochlorococcus]MCH2565047.1 photosystem I reaction center protein subunit XI [Prochlorococcus sp. ALOHA_A2.0_51]MEC9027753.1 photosystem I reaction center protein subunit XI [Cyanobacteriota bacterium]ABM79081.1 Photosystem I PsaL protein (subunit XI) [Prochlorococcus marinus str. MIT 9303]KZR61707.1 Photosystem I reaction center subunit XI [Prochlorococcus sp. MIT 1306]KZR63655.1 Photosystem I reaction center subunit XI [Proc|tara:strand:- start:34 stop:597 length:564 start_codon:yes stop_codon:yes gene_type:complete
MTDENLPLGPKTLNEKYRDRGHVEEWAVQPAADPCVGNLATPVNSGYFVKALVNNLPLYREGISANFRGLETGAAIGYFIYGPFLVMGPLRTTDFATTAALLATVGAVHILTALLVLYNVPGKAPTVPPPDVTVANPPADLFTRKGWADFTSGFWLGGCAGAAFAWFLCNTLHMQPLLNVPMNVWAS